MKVRVFCQKCKFIISTSPLQLNHTALLSPSLYCHNVHLISKACQGIKALQWRQTHPHHPTTKPFANINDYLPDILTLNSNLETRAKIALWSQLGTGHEQQHASSSSPSPPSSSSTSAVSVPSASKASSVSLASAA